MLRPLMADELARARVERLLADGADRPRQTGPGRRRRGWRHVVGTRLARVGQRLIDTA